MTPYVPVRRIVAWLKVQRNRKKVYKVAKFLVPLAVAGGVLTTGEASDVLSVVAFVLGFGGLHLADKNT